MKTKYKWVEFIYNEDRESWDVWNHRFKQYLGYIKFNVSTNWKEWEFLPDSYTLFTKQCLADIIDFIKQLDAKENNL